MLGDHIVDIVEKHGNNVHFEIYLNPKTLNLSTLSEEEIISTFKLRMRMNFTNMHAWNIENRITKYESSMDILNEFYDVRLHYYNLRKEHMLLSMRQKTVLFPNRTRFIASCRSLETCNDFIDLRPDEEIIIERLVELEFDIIDDSFNYLLDMPLRSISQKKFDKLQEELNALLKNIDVLEETDVEQLWLSDLQHLESYL